MGRMKEVHHDKIERGMRNANKTEYNFLSFMVDAREKELMEDVHMICHREGITCFSIGDEYGTIDMKGYSECDMTDRGVPIEACHICYRDCHSNGIDKIKGFLCDKNIDFHVYQLYHKKD